MTTNEQSFGSAGVIAPPIFFESREYSLLLKFNASKESGPYSDIVTGIIERIDRLGEKRFRVTCQRGSTQFSYTKPPDAPGQGSTEVVYSCVTGGNICQTPEPLRLYSWVSDSASRGARSGERAEPMDMMWRGSRSMFIEQAIPFGQSPIGGVNYASGQALPTANIITHTAGAVNFDPLDNVKYPNARYDFKMIGRTDHFIAAGLYIADATAPGGYTRLTRRQFVPPSGVPDPSYFPFSVTMAQGEYWTDENGLVVFASANEGMTGSSSQCAGIAFANGFGPQWTSEARETTIVGDESLQGYAATGSLDRVTGWAVQVRSNFQISFNIPYPGGSADSFGTFAIDVNMSDRFRRLAVLINGRNIVGVKARTSNTGGMVDQDFIPNASPLPLPVWALRITKVGNVYTVEYDAGAGWQAVAVVTLPDVPVNAFALVGPMTWGNNFASVAEPSGFEIYRVNEAVGDVYREYGQVWTGIKYRQVYPLASNTAIDYVKSEITGRVYTANSEARGGYFRTSNQVQIYSDSSIDTIRIQQVASTAPIPSPGRCPRVVYPKNMATPRTGDNPEFEPTSNPLENRANWHDVFIGTTPDGDFPGAPGDPITIRRNAVLDPRSGYTLEFATREVDTGTEVWTAIPQTEYLARPAEGIFILSRDWVTANIAGKEACFRLSGRYIQHHANLDARTINEFDGALDVLPTLFCRMPASGEATAIAGFVKPRRVVAVTQDCAGLQDLMIGLTRENWEGTIGGAFWDRIFPDWLDFGNLSVPQVWADASTGGYGINPAVFDSTVPSDGPNWTRALNSVWTECGGGPGGFDRKNFGAAGTKMIYSPWGPPQAALQPGYTFVIGANVGGMELEPDQGSMFFCAGRGFNIPPQLTRAPHGTVVVSASAEVEFTDLESYDWTVDIQNGHFARTPSTFGTPPTTRRRLYLNGELAGDSTLPPFPPVDPREGASIGFDLIARRRKTTNLVGNLNRAAVQWTWELGMEPPYIPTDEDIAELEADTTFPVDANDWVSLVSGLLSTTAVESGKRQIVDVTQAMQAMLDSRTSNLTGYQIIPSAGKVAMDDTGDSLRGLLMAQMPSHSLTYEEFNSSLYVYQHVVSGRFMFFEDWLIHSLLVSVRFPDGTLATYPCPPIKRGKMIGFFGTISGLIYNDENGNGKQDDEEDYTEGGFNNVQVTLTDALGNVRVTTTNADGVYTFDKVTEGAATVHINEAYLPAVPHPGEGTNPTALVIQGGRVSRVVNGYRIIEPPPMP